MSYRRFIILRYNLDPDSRDPVKFVDDPELGYVMTRYRLALSEVLKPGLSSKKII